MRLDELIHGSVCQSPSGVNKARPGRWGQGGGESEAKFKGHREIQQRNNISIIIKLITKIGTTDQVLGALALDLRM